VCSRALEQVRVHDAALLMAVAMYRPLTATALVPLHAALEPIDASQLLVSFDACQLTAVPLAHAAVEVHLTRPHERARFAASLPRVTPRHHPSSHVQAFYRDTLYPIWQVPESGSAPRTTIGASLQRHYPWLDWPFDESDAHPPLRVCIAGAGSGHQVAQAALTFSRCTMVALDLSDSSLAYAHEQMVRVLPGEAHRVTWLVGDLMRLGDGVTGGLSTDATEPDATMVRTYEQHMRPKFHLVMCFGVVHHCTDPAAALRRLVRATLLPGGVLQLGTYSTYAVRTWRPAARTLLHRIAPEVVSEDGELIRLPTPNELRAIRSAILELANAPSSQQTEPAQAASGQPADLAHAGSAQSESGADAADVRGPLLEGGGGAGAAKTGGAGGVETEATDGRERATAQMLTLFDEFYSHGGALDLLFHPQVTRPDLI
jgi:SAM-dependent methyltransferase